MKAEALKKERIEDFKKYCMKHSKEVDETFLGEEDFKDFEPNEDNPTYIITDQQNRIIAAASLIINDYHRRGRKGRFRIFHSEVDNMEYYEVLLQAVLRHTEGLDKIIIFISLDNKKTIGYFENLNFNVDRYSFLLLREDLEVPGSGFSKEYEIKSFKLGQDEDTWCKIRNISFANLKGSETPLTPEMVAKIMTEDDHIEGGAMILYHGEKPVGVVRGTADDYEDSAIMVIGPLAIIPEYQGKGLGRELLRASLRFAKEKSYTRTLLCVNGENERAKALYLDEGFKEAEAVVCYKYDLNISRK